MPGSGDARASGGSPARAPASSRDVWFDAEDSSGTRRGDSARAHLNSADVEDADASDAEVAAIGSPRPTVARWALADVPTGRDSPGFVYRRGDEDADASVRAGMGGAVRGAGAIGARVDDLDAGSVRAGRAFPGALDPPSWGGPTRDSGSARARLEPARAPSLRKMDRTKSWGTQRIDDLEAEREARRRDASLRSPLTQLRRENFFASLKLYYILRFGEPIADENVHADDRAWVAKTLAKENWWVIHPFSPFRRNWDLLIVLCLAYIALLVPFVIGFEVRYRRGHALWSVDRLVDALFIADIGFNYVTGYASRDRSRVVLDPRSIASHYTRTWMPLDVLASVPFDLIFPDAGGGDAGDPNSAAYGRGAKFVRVMKLVRLVKLFRMLRLNRILHRLERKLSIKYGLWQVIKFAACVACLAHWQACAWFGIHVLQVRGEFGQTWVELLAENQGQTRTLDDESRFTQYAACVYWAITTMTTIGYGDIVPSNRDERVLTVFAELLGACVFLYGLTQVTSLIANINHADVEFQRLMDEANEYFEFRNIPSPLRAKVREFLHYKRASSLFHAERKLLNHLSDDIRVEVQMWSMRNALNATPFLRDADEQFVKTIVDKLVRKVYSPREIVIREGDIGSEMFFVAHGEVEVIAGQTRIAYLNEGAMIGEIAVAMRTRRTATVRTVTFTELLVLSRAKFQHAARLVPETARAMTEYAVRRLRAALWRRARSKARLIFCVNAILRNSGRETLGQMAASGNDMVGGLLEEEEAFERRRGQHRQSAPGGLSADSPRVSRASSTRGMTGRRGGSRLDLAGFFYRGDPGNGQNAGKLGEPRGSSVRNGGAFGSIAPFAFSSIALYDAAVESAPVPSMDDFFDETAEPARGSFDAAGARIEGDAVRSPFEMGGSRYVRREVHGVTTSCAAAAMAAQQMLARLDAAADEDDPTGRSAEAECEAAAGELAALLRRVAAHSEIAADRVQANYRQRRSGASGVVSARAGAA